MYAGVMRPAPPGSEAHRPMAEGEAQLAALPREFGFAWPRLLYHHRPCASGEPVCTELPKPGARIR
jgi:hypothetical protein